jgi:hypothetical protein
MIVEKYIYTNRRGNPGMVILGMMWYMFSAQRGPVRRWTDVKYSAVAGMVTRNCRIAALGRSCATCRRALQGFPIWVKYRCVKTVKSRYLFFFVRDAECDSHVHLHSVHSVYHVNMLKFSATWIWLLTISRCRSFVQGVLTISLVCSNLLLNSFIFYSVSTHSF